MTPDSPDSPSAAQEGGKKPQPARPAPPGRKEGPGPQSPGTARPEEEAETEKPAPEESREAEDRAAVEDTGPKSIQRVRISMNVGVQILLMLVLFGVVNYLAARHFKQWDYTFDRKFTLSESTKDYLGKVSVPIRITALTVRGSDPEKDISALLQQYKETAKGRVEVKVIDTRRDVQAYEAFRARLFKSGPRIETNGVLVESDAGGKAHSLQNTAPFITEDDLYEMDPVKKVATAFKGESLLNSAIRSVTSTDQPVIGIVVGLGTRRQLPDGTSVYDKLFEMAKLQNIKLEPFNIFEENAVPDHLHALIWVAPADVSPREHEMLTRFLETPGHSMLVMLNPANLTPALDKFLTAYGISPQEDRVLTASAAGKRFDVDARFLEGSPLTQRIVSQSTIFLDQSRSLKVAGGTEKIRAENIEVKPFLGTAADTFWGEKNFDEPYPRFDPGTDNGPPIHLGIAAERGAARDPRVQVKSSRLIVFGNSAFGDPDSITPLNYDILTRSLNWMLHRDVVAPNDSSTDKIKHRFRIMIKPEQWQRVFWTTTVILPLAALMTGLMVWSSRRN